MEDIERPTASSPWGVDISIMVNNNWTAGNYVNNQTNVSSNCSENPGDPDSSGYVTVNTMSVVSAALYTLICVTGLMGNGLVIFVVLRYAKMKTVTNMYILNLAVADLCFLIGLPFLIITSILQRWIFGFVICKLFYISTSINWYTSVFTLTAMSADRFLAVCHPIRAMRYRTPIISRIVCVCVWSASLLAMLPMVLYTTTKPNDFGTGVSCTIDWPPNGSIAFIWYALMLGFAIPVFLIVVFYTLVVMKLKTVGPKHKSKEKKKSHKKVTQMVLTVITVYVICWLPYWVFQIVLNHISSMPVWTIHLFQIITVLSYANSMMNPVLYAFLSENFRKSFAKAFKCANEAEVNRALQGDHSMAHSRQTPKATTTTMTTVSIRSSKSTEPSSKVVLSPLSEDEMEVLTETNSGNGMLDLKPEVHLADTQVACLDSNDQHVTIGKVNGQNRQTVTML